MSNNKRSSDNDFENYIMGAAVGAAVTSASIAQADYSRSYKLGLHYGRQFQQDQSKNRLINAPTYVAAYNLSIKDLSEKGQLAVEDKKKHISEEFKKCDSRWFFKKSCKIRSVAAAQNDLQKRLQNLTVSNPPIENKDVAALASIAKEQAVKDFSSEIPKLVKMLTLESKEEDTNLKPRR